MYEKELVEQTKMEIQKALDELPPENISQVARFINHLRFKAQPSADSPLAKKNSTPGGLWKGISFTEEEIAEARREMWGSLGKGEI